MDTIEPLVVTPEAALSIKPFGLDMRVLLASGSTGGAVSVVMVCHKPGEGAFDHLHHTQDECLFIVEGRYEVVVAGSVRIVGPGTVVFIPRGVTHRFTNIGTSTGRMLDWSSPGGQDRYFRAIAALGADEGFDDNKAREIGQRFDMHFLDGR